MGLKLNLIVHKVAGGGRTDAVQNLSCQRRASFTCEMKVLDIRKSRF